MQRDLSDSTVERNMGVALGYTYIAFVETMRGLDKLQLNKEKCIQELEESPELLAEPIQTILKTVGVDDPYTLLKQASRGKKPTKESLVELVNSLNISQAVKDYCNNLSSLEYVGDAVRICELVLSETKKLIASEALHV